MCFATAVLSLVKNLMVTIMMTNGIVRRDKLDEAGFYVYRLCRFVCKQVCIF